MHMQNPCVTVASYGRREQKRMISATVSGDKKFHGPIDPKSSVGPPHPPQRFHAGPGNLLFAISSKINHDDEVQKVPRLLHRG